MRILVVEDDNLTGLSLVHNLTAQHYAVSLATDGETGLQLAQDWDYDLVMLDVMLPKLDGISVCQQLRAQGYNLPILLLTAKNGSEDRVLGLDAGADDYVVKPFDLPELMARVRALLRRNKGDKTTVITWENVQLDLATNQVTCGAQTLHLTPKEYALLELFLLNPKRIFSRANILDRLWDFADAPGEETVSSHIYSLRQKLKAADSEDFIETVYGLGYRLKEPTVLSPEALSPETELAAQAELSSDTQLSPAAELSPAAQAAPSRGQDSLTFAASSPQQRQMERTIRNWQKFKPKFLDQVQVLEQVGEQLTRDPLQPEQRRQAEAIAHKLAGSLGLLGWQAGSELARQLELFFREELPEAVAAGSATGAGAAGVAGMREQVRSLRQGIEAVTLEEQGLILPESQTVPTPPFSRLLIVEDDLLLVEELRLEATLWGMKVDLATDLTVARRMIAQQPPDVVVLDLNFPGSSEDGLSLLRELAEQWPQIPVLVSTVRASLRDRIEVVRLGGRAFLCKPLPTHEILQAVAAALKPNGQPQVNRVMAVTPDRNLLARLSTWLQPWGVEVTASEQPQRFWEILTASLPDLLLIDLNLPGFSGIDLCQVVRHDPHWQELPILVITAPTDMLLMHQLFAAGVTDVIQTPLMEADLVKRVVSRLDYPKSPL